MPRRQRETIAAKATELARRQREQTRTRLQQAKADGRLDAQAVADFAWLHMTDDYGRPITPAAHHWLWLDLMCNQAIKKLLIIAPPESAKTTWLLAYYGTSIAFYPEWPHSIAAVTGSVAIKRSITLRNVVTSPEFQATFPEVQPAVGMTWNQDEWSVAPNGRSRPGRVHPTMGAMGVGGSIIGSRARLAGGDDLHDQENSRTANQRDQVHTWLHQSFLSRRMSRVGRSIVIGTAWHHDDTYARMKAEGGWVVCHLPILSAGPEVWAIITYPDGYAGERLGEPVSQAELNELEELNESENV
ncbi:MAG: hypothetical protein H6661_10180 [Ardenticatenaceae bacterium]|nr:hypothetical protein [Ardenticatenaceae bacterium]